MEYKDYYAVLGVPRTASKAEIKKAFRKLAREHHPDARPGDAASERRFKDVNEAHAVLSDPEKRSLYDRLGADWESYARAGATAGAGAAAGAGAGSRGRGAPFTGFAEGPGGIRYEFHTTGGGEGFSDFFNAFFAGASQPTGTSQPTGASGQAGRRTGGATLEEMLAGLGLDPSGAAPGAGSGPGAASGPQRRRAARPAAAEAVAEITLDEAYHGTTRVVEVDGKRLEVTIPRGADTGTRIRLTGKAPGGGDLHVLVRQGPDPVYRRRGADLERELPLTLGEALLGAEVPVRTPKGRVLLTIPAGTQSGRTFRLSGRGMPRFKADGFGDVLVKARVVLPTDLSDEARKQATTFIQLIDQPDPRTSET